MAYEGRSWYSRSEVADTILIFFPRAKLLVRHIPSTVLGLPASTCKEKQIVFFYTLKGLSHEMDLAFDDMYSIAGSRPI